MVDKSRGVDVDGSLKEREWNTEEFYFVLNQHTEQVGYVFCKIIQFSENSFRTFCKCFSFIS